VRGEGVVAECTEPLVQRLRSLAAPERSWVDERDEVRQAGVLGAGGHAGRACPAGTASRQARIVSHGMRFLQDA
jgi:hypothetical protein